MSRLALMGVAIIVLPAAQLLFTLQNTEAAVIASDNFELYTLGTAIGQGASGSGWGGSYSGLAATNSGSVSLRSISTNVLPGFGQSLELGFSAVQTGTGMRTNSNLLQRQFDEQSGTVYVGFVLKTVGFDTTASPGTTNQDFFQFYVNNTSNDSGTTGSQAESLSIGLDYGVVAGGTPSRFFARKGTGTPAYNAVDHANDTLYRLVFKLSKSGDNGGNYDESALFINQLTEGTPDAARVSADATNLTAGSLTAISTMHFRITGMDLGDRVYLDNLQIATTYAEALPTLPVPGDFDSDGDVDGADFVAWQTNFPKADSATLASGDADGDGDVDGADFVVWQTHFPFTPGPGALPVPEPTAALMMFAAVVMLSLAMFRQRQAKVISDLIQSR